MNITNQKCHPVNIVLGLVISLVLLFPSQIRAEATGKVSITNSEGKLLQFTSAGDMLGFAGDGVIIASARHMLRIDFLDSGAVAPEADETAQL